MNISMTSVEVALGLIRIMLKGLASIDESDYFIPNRLTATIIPISSYKTVTVIADVHQGLGKVD